jgi:hypothetical protein
MARPSLYTQSLPNNGCQVAARNIIERDTIVSDQGFVVVSPSVFVLSPDRQRKDRRTTVEEKIRHGASGPKSTHVAT